MDPVGPQASINVPGDRSTGQSGKKAILKERLGEVEPSSTNWGGGFNTSSGTRKADFKTAPRSTAHQIDDWQGTVHKDGIHTYGTGKKGDTDRD